MQQNKKIKKSNLKLMSRYIPSPPKQPVCPGILSLRNHRSNILPRQQLNQQIKILNRNKHCPIRAQEIFDLIKVKIAIREIKFTL